MAGLFNTGIRDYCGEESSLTKLSNHFSKDYGLQQEGFHDNIIPQDLDSIPTTFELNQLLKEAINKNNTSQVNPRFEDAIINKSDSNNFVDKENLSTDGLNFTNFQPSPNYFQNPNIMITSNMVSNQFIPPDPALIAVQWAENELSKFDDNIILEDDLKLLTQDSNLTQPRFIDVLQNMVITESKTDVDLFQDGNPPNETSSVYDLDKDLKNMRDKIDLDSDDTAVWNNIEKSLQQNLTEMVFNPTNQYLDDLKTKEKSDTLNNDIAETLSKGIKLYKEGYFSEATLALEAVVQMEPCSEVAWSYLGQSLSENEQDYRAIIACNKCLELNKNNREVLLSLARIHCNEMNLSSTIGCLEQWLLAHPKYFDLATVGQDVIHSSTGSNLSMWDDMYEVGFESSGNFAIIDEQFNQALNRNLFDIDPELEIAAGTLYHAVQDYDRATSRFEAAVNVVKDNACLWNKLGTAYCNSGNYEKAVNAYRKSLELAPGFARAECNLGVAYYNMESYNEAIKHAIQAYKIQKPEKGTNSTNSYDRSIESDPIWTLIRMSSFKLDRPDLDLIIFSRDVEALSKEFCV